MKKILLIVAITLCIFQVVVLATAIDIGDEATDRAALLVATHTRVNKGNPANATGKITLIEIWAATELLNCKVATFYSEGGNNFSTRDWEAIGTVAPGAKREFVVDIEVEAGDLIGWYATNGNIEGDNTVGDGEWVTVSTDSIPCTNVEFTFYDERAHSLKGIGTTEEGNAILFGTNF